MTTDMSSIDFESPHSTGQCAVFAKLTASIHLCLSHVVLLSSQNAQRLGGSQVPQPLTTPVVSVATPSLLAPFSAMQTAYNTGKKNTIVVLETPLCHHSLY